jgi:hypothetical protein
VIKSLFSTPNAMLVAGLGRDIIARFLPSGKSNNIPPVVAA